MKAACVSLALLSVASASPLNLGLFRRSGEVAQPARTDDCTTQGVQIVSKDDGKCLQPEQQKQEHHRRSNDNKAPIAKGTKVVTVDCKDAPLLWNLPKKEGGAVVLSDYPELAIDAGRHPADRGHLSLYKTNGTPQQQWIINEAHQIQLRDGKQCLDDGDRGLQTYTCTPGNKNQEFEVRPVKCPKSSAPAKTTEAAKTSEKKEVETVYKTEHKTETKYDVKPTTVHQTKYETKYETKVETKTQPAVTVTAPAQTKYETKYETKVETKTQPAVTVTAPAQTKYETKTETKYETKTINQTQPAVTVTAPAQTKYETKYETKIETKTQPAVTVTAPAQTVYKTETKHVEKPTTVKVTETVKASGKPVTLTVVHHPEESKSAEQGKGEQHYASEAAKPSQH